MMAQSGSSRQAAVALAAAIQQEGRIQALPGQGPRDLDEAYAIQSSIVASLGGVGGWKVSPLRPEAPPRCSPIPSFFFHHAPATLPATALSRCEAEVEIAVLLGADPPRRDRALSADEVAAAIASVHPAVELCASRFSQPSETPDLLRLADLQNCAGVVLGAGIHDWRGIEFADLVMELRFGGSAHRGAAPQPGTERTLAAIGWLAGHAEARGMPLRAGQIIITGARLGPLALGAVGELTAVAGALGKVKVARH